MTIVCFILILDYTRTYKESKAFLIQNKQYNIIINLRSMTNDHVCLILIKIT